MTINHLYANYDLNTQKEVRKLEGLEHKLVKHRGVHIFNFWCLHEKVIPTAAKYNSKVTFMLNKPSLEELNYP